MADAEKHSLQQKKKIRKLAQENRKFKHQWNYE